MKHILTSTFYIFTFFAIILSCNKLTREKDIIPIPRDLEITFQFSVMEKEKWYALYAIRYLYLNMQQEYNKEKFNTILFKAYLNSEIGRQHIKGKFMPMINSSEAYFVIIEKAFEHTVSHFDIYSKNKYIRTFMLELAGGCYLDKYWESADVMYYSDRMEEILFNLIADNQPSYLYKSLLLRTSGLICRPSGNGILDINPKYKHKAPKTFYGFTNHWKSLLR